MMIERSYEPSFTLALAAKDARLALEAAREAGLELPALAAIREQLERGVELGHGDSDMAAAVEASRRDEPRADRRRLPERLRGARRRAVGARGRHDRRAHQRARALGRVRPGGGDARLAPAGARLVRRAGRPVAGALRAGLAGRAAAPGARRGGDRRDRRQGPGPGHRGLLGLRRHEPRRAAARARGDRGDGRRAGDGLLRQADRAGGAAGGLHGDRRHHRGARRGGAGRAIPSARVAEMRAAGASVA